MLDIRKENFPSILGVSSPFDFLSTMNPLILSSSQTAQIIQMSAIGAFVILEMIYTYIWREAVNAELLMMVLIVNLLP